MTSQYEAAQASITAQMIALLIRAMRKFGIPLTDPARRQFAQRIYPDVQFARQRSYVLATHYMQESATAAREPLPRIATIDDYQPDAIVKLLERAANPVEKATPQVSALDQVTRRLSSVRVVDNFDPNDPRAVVRVGRNAGAAAARHAHQAGRDAVQHTADAADEKIGWARVLTGAENCGFCAMLASRGPVYTSEHVALSSNIGGSAYHDHCDCRAELVFKGKPWSGEAEYERLEELWRTATKRKSGKAAVRAFSAAYSGT